MFQIAEEEEVKRLRREMVPRAQLMPYFDRPFMPRRYVESLGTFYSGNYVDEEFQSAV